MVWNVLTRTENHGSLQAVKMSFANINQKAQCDKIPQSFQNFSTNSLLQMETFRKVFLNSWFATRNTDPIETVLNSGASGRTVSMDGGRRPRAP